MRKVVDTSSTCIDAYGSFSDMSLSDGYESTLQPSSLGSRSLPDSDEISIRNQRTLSFVARNLHVPRNSVCGGTIHSLAASMKSGEVSRKNTKILLDNPNLFARALSEKLTGPWIEHAFEKRECIKFVGQRSNSDRCGCGRLLSAHSQLAQSRFTIYGRQDVLDASLTNDDNIRLKPQIASASSNEEQWSIARHTHTAPTDAFGTIVFQGGAHAHKAQYVRLGYDSKPEDIMYLMEKVWGLQPPNLVITVHGGMTNFEVQEKLGRSFREGILKAAQTTGAWVLTGGLDSGVVRHVAQALDEAGISARMRSKIVTIGIAPWGVIKRRERLIAKDTEIQYDSHSFGSSNGLGILNDRHSYFLLADNGTTGRFGADLHLRQNFENYLVEMPNDKTHQKVPVVCAVLEGGTSTIKAVHQYVTQKPDIPVIVCDGSGRASDLLSFASRYIESDEPFPVEVREQLLALISTVFPDQLGQASEQLLDTIIECARRPDLLTIYRFGDEKQEDVDHSILTAVLRGQNLSLPDQLALTLSWNRVDVARSCLFSGGKNWPIHHLHGAMSEALRLDRVEFVELLLENGVSMKNFLSVSTLEQLYNLDEGPAHSVRFLVDNNAQDQTTFLTLPDIGVIIEKLIGNAYRHYYTSRQFKRNYEHFRKKAQLSRLSTFHIRLVSRTGAKREKADRRGSDPSHDFLYPFNDLMLWAILTRRPEMAHCMWLHGEDAMAKGLVAIRLYKAIGRIAEEEYLEVEVANKLREYADVFRSECLGLLDFCYREDNEQTLRLLTAELPHWGHHNCLSLAVLANNKHFLAHPCCQMLLAELWHGSLRVRSGSNIRVLTALLCPPAALILAFKTPLVYSESENTARKDDDSKKDDQETFYDTMSSYRDLTNVPKPVSNGNGSVMSLHLNKLFKPQPRQYLSSRTGEEMEELMENGIAAGSSLQPPKKSIMPNSKKNSTALIYESTASLTTNHIPRLTAYAKFRAFYSAPITKFWSWCLAFHLFLTMSTYVLLIETPLKPTKIEWATLIFMIVFAIEHLRKLCCQETPRLWNKFRMFYSRYYNGLTLLALLLFLLGFLLRLDPNMRHSHGRVILSCSNVLWYMKVLEYLSVHPLLGPYIQMAAKMVVSMCYIIVLLLVTLMAFGVSRQAITFPHEKWSWLLVRNIFYKPYFMLYGEVYAGEIDTCNDEAMYCVPGGWIPPILMTIFLLVANILLINMLIAIFNNIFNDTNVRSKEVWLFQRYGQIMEYNDTPLLPPPFTIISHFIYLFMYFCEDRLFKKKKKQKQNSGLLDFSMKLNLRPEELRELHDFEEDCMDELTRKRQSRVKGTTEERFSQTIEQ
ncbi:unnamed protein product [Auanema sp. JU1783]|nr:unnamed protein product [Auanema sp. JU1783]